MDIFSIDMIQETPPQVAQYGRGHPIPRSNPKVRVKGRAHGHGHQSQGQINPQPPPPTPMKPKMSSYPHVLYYSPHRSFDLLKNVCERSWRQLQPIARKKGFISMYRSTLVSGFVNILVFFNKLANNFKPLDRFF